MFGFLKKNKKDQKKKAMVYIDFEHWYISMDKLHRERPDIKGFRDELAEKYDIIDMAFFGDFSNPSLRGEIQNIRVVSNNIIETQNASPNFEKDFTDFIILDHIYQSAVNQNKNIDAYIIFTGDGHFASCVSFLVNKCKKEVGIYAVKDAASNQLSSAATYIRLLPDSFEDNKKYAMMVIKNLSVFFNKNKGKKLFPTFWATIESTAKKNKVSKDKVEKALRWLINNGYVHQNTVTSKKKAVKVLFVNWQAVNKDGLFEQ